MKHRLLILGTLGEFVQLVKKSKERGYYTIVCDGYPDGPARQYADASYVIPVTDIDAVACVWMPISEHSTLQAAYEACNAYAASGQTHDALMVVSSDAEQYGRLKSHLLETAQ